MIDAITLSCDLKYTVVKWDASMIDSPPEVTDPATHPACIEVLMIEGQTPTTIYRRNDDASHD